MKNFCYTPIKGIDDIIAEKINSKVGESNWTPYRVAILRGIYDENESIPLNVDNLDTAADAIIRYRSSLARKNISEVNKGFNKKSSIGKNLVSIYNQLKKAFSPEERFNRVSMISTIFSDVVDALKEEHPELSRDSIIKGIKVDDTVIGGQSIIFSRVFEEIMNYYAEALEDRDTEKAEKYKAVIDNWAALTVLARIRLRDTEHLKLGEKIQFVDEANEDNYSEYVQSFDIEESKREAWQEESDKKSAFGGIGKGTRRVLGNIIKYDENGEVYDDLDFPVMIDPVRAHQTISKLLIGITSEKHMLEILRSESRRLNWLTPIIEELEKNNRLRTQFYIDFHKGNQLYSLLGTDKRKSRNGIKYWITKILNRETNDPLKQYLARISLGNPIDSTSIFDKNGNVDWANLKKFRDKINNYLVADKSNSQFAESKFWGKDSNGKLIMSWNEKRQLVRDLLNSIGIPTDKETMDNIMNFKNTKNLRTIIRLFEQISTHGIAPIVGKELESNIQSNKEQSFSKFIQIQRTGSAYNIKESISKLLKIINNQGKGLRYERRARYTDSKGKTVSYDSYVNPSYMSDVFGAISSFVVNNDRLGLQRYIENRFLKSSYFYDKSLQTGNTINPDGILNQWIKELYTSTMDEDGFANNFIFERFLGDDTDTPFEDFTSKKHLISVLEMYFSDRQIAKNSKYAHYPVFILGDSGVAKFIKARRYSSQEILDGMYKIFLQERRGMKLAEAINKKLKENGFEPIENFSESATKYGFLTFLNEEKYSRMIDPNHYEQSVKNAIKEYMSEKVAKFKKDAARLGVLKTVTIKEGKNEKTVYEYLNQIATPETIDKSLAEFYWNYKFAMINQLQMFTISPLFYKGTKDLQKRYKEIHAPGTGLSIQARDSRGNLYSETGIETCIYIKDIKLPATNSFISAINADEKTRAYTEKYLNNTLTDGQGFRSLDSYRKVKGMAGQWTEEHEAAYNAIKALRTKYRRDEQISNEDLAEIAKLAVVFQPIKPYMFTHEHLKVNTSDEVPIPIQHKYSECVLIPELLPNGLLKDMAYYMEDHNIDLIVSTTAVKVGNFGATDISKVETTEELNAALSKGYTHQLSYEDYRIQTNLLEHLNAEQLFGTQVKKLIMANVKMNDSKYSKYINGEKINLGDNKLVTLNGRNLIAFYNALIVANTLDSYNTFKSQVENIDNLSNIFLQSIISNSRESVDNMNAYSLNENGDFNTPIFEGELEHDSSATLFSIFKKTVNKQKIKGGSAVQASALGIVGYEKDGNLECIVDPNDPNNILYAECEIPFDLSYTDFKGNTIPLRFEDWCNSDGTLKLGKVLKESDPEYREYLSYKDEEGRVCKPKIEERFPGILNIIAYRIPTEKEYSIFNLKIARFSQKTAGGVIKVPVQGTTIAGFDFDGDKLYFMMKEFVSTVEKDEAIDNLLEAIFEEKVADVEEYDFTKSPLENTRAARNNMIIDLIRQRLMDPETFSRRYTPGGFEGASKAARFIRELLFSPIEEITDGGKVSFEKIKERAKDKSLDPEPNYDPTDVMTLITYNQQNQVAGKLIGIFANQNTNHAFASLMKSFVLKVPISFCGHSYSDLLNAPEGVDVDQNVTEFQSASVDAVKDPVLNFLNLNTLTSNAGALLARIGYTTEEIGLLFEQPVIREICEYAFNNQTTLEVATATIMGDYRAIIGNEDISIQDKNILLSKEHLAENILNDRISIERGKEAKNSPSFVYGQLVVVELFNNIVQSANDVTRFVTTSKFTASNAVGSTFGHLYAQLMRVRKYLKDSYNKKLSFIVEVTDTINTTISNDDSQLSMSDKDYMMALLYNPFGYEQAMYDMNRRVLKLLSKYFPYETSAYKETRDFIASLTKGEVLDADTIDSIHRDILAYMLSQREGSLFNGEQPIRINNEVITAREYYTNRFAKRLYEEIIKNPELKSYMILSDQFAEFIIDENTEAVSLQISNVGGLQSYQKEAIKESWEQLSEDYPNIARDLFIYNFYKTGFNFSPFAFMNLAPNSVKQLIEVGNGVTYTDFLREVQRGEVRINTDDFAKQYILNHLTNRKLVFHPKGNILDTIKKRYKKGDVMLNSFDLDIAELNEDEQKIWTMGNNEFKELKFRPCIMIHGIPYIADGDGTTFNTSTGTTMTYRKANAQGSSNKSLMFLSSTEKSKDFGIIEDMAFEGSTSIEPEVSTSEPFNRSSIISEIAKEFKAGYDAANIRDEIGELYSINAFIALLEDQSDEMLLQQVENIRKACRKNGILVLDSEGNLMQNC